MQHLSNRRQATFSCGALMFAVSLLAIASIAQAEDWNQWRGTARDGFLPANAFPKKWPEEPVQVWRVEIGIGHASPVMAGDRVFTLSRDADKETVRALRIDNGQEIWKQSYAAPYKVHSAAEGHGKGPKSTPVAYKGKLFTLGISGILTAWDAASGKRIWQREFSRDFPSTSPLYGAAMSPLVEGATVIAHVGGHDAGMLAAFDQATGEVKWKWAEDGPAYASPVIATIAGVRQLITQTQRACIAIAPSTGKLLWQVPFTTDYDQNSVTPVVFGDGVIFGGYSKPTFAVRVAKQGAGLSTKATWKGAAFPMYMSSPLLVDETMYGLSQRNSGQLFAANARDGKTLWTGKPRMGENAALVTDGKIIAALTTNSELIVFRAAPDAFKSVATFTVADSPTWAHPVFFDGKLLIKDETQLTLWRLGEQK